MSTTTMTTTVTIGEEKEKKAVDSSEKLENFLKWFRDDLFATWSHEGDVIVNFGCASTHVSTQLTKKPKSIINLDSNYSLLMRGRKFVDENSLDHVQFHHFDFMDSKHASYVNLVSKNIIGSENSINVFNLQDSVSSFYQKDQNHQNMEIEELRFALQWMRIFIKCDGYMMGFLPNNDSKDKQMWKSFMQECLSCDFFLIHTELSNRLVVDYLEYQVKNNIRVDPNLLTHVQPFCLRSFVFQKKCKLL